MSTAMTMSLAAGRRWTPWRIDAGVAALVTLAILAIHAGASFPTLAGSNGDNDSLLRLVEVRDLIAGQGWFDLQQYRMGPAGGFLMHWSRLVDAPIAALILMFSALTGSVATGETIAMVAWPTMLLFAATTCLLRIGRRFSDRDAILPIAILGGAALHFTGIFAPGALDHHNVQLVLTLAMVALLAGTPRFSHAALAGAAAAMMLAVGMETAPYVGIAGLYLALAYLIAGEPQRINAAGFGSGFAAGGAACFVATVGPGHWLAATCDAYSWPQASLALIGGGGLAAAALSARLSASRFSRLLALASIGAASAGLAVALFPQCLGDPYAGLDPRLKDFWLSSVTEALPVWSILENKPAMAPAYYATPLIGFGWLAWSVWRGLRPVDALVGAFLGTAILVSFWQVRGSMFSIPLAAIPLSAWATEARARARTAGTTSASLGMAAVWLVSLNMAWSGGARLVAEQFDTRGSATSSSGACYSHDDYAELAALPATTVLAVSNLGASILRDTHHRALAGPYHRNVAGNLTVLDAFTGTAEAAEVIVRANDVGLVAYCPGNDETGVLADRAPGGLMADLREGHVPAWLTPLASSKTSPIRLYAAVPIN